MIIQFMWTEDADHSVALPSYESDGAAGADLRANFAPVQRSAGITVAPSPFSGTVNFWMLSVANRMNSALQFVFF